MSNKDKINLLTAVEIEELYALPKFNDLERDYYFQLTDSEHELLKNYTSIKSKVFLILQIGYFNAKKQFYKFTLDEVKEDIVHIIRKHYDPTKFEKQISGKLWKENYRGQKSDILKLHGYQEWSPHFKERVLRQLGNLIRLYPKGNDTLRELFVFFEKEKITIPSYRTLQDLFTLTFKTERDRLEKIMTAIPGDLKQQLDEIIKNDNSLTELNVIRMGQAPIFSTTY